MFKKLRLWYTNRQLLKKIYNLYRTGVYRNNTTYDFLHGRSFMGIILSDSDGKERVHVYQYITRFHINETEFYDISDANFNLYGKIMRLKHKEKLERERIIKSDKAKRVDEMVSKK